MEIIRTVTLKCSFEKPEEFAKEAVVFMVQNEAVLNERIRCHYGEECQEVFKSVRVPAQVYAENMDWDVELLKIVQSFRS